MKSPEFTGPKKGAGADRSTGLQTIANRVNLSTSKSGSALLDPPLLKTVESNPKFPFSRMNQNIGWEKEKLWAEPSGVKYVDYMPTDISSRERNKPLYELSQHSAHESDIFQKPNPDSLLIQELMKSPEATGEKSNRFNQGGYIPEILQASSLHNTSKYSAPGDSNLLKPPATTGQYKFYSAQSSKDVGPSGLKEYSSYQEAIADPKGGQTSSPRGHESDSWSGFSILKRYASKEILERVDKPAAIKSHRNELIDKYADESLAKAFFKESPKKLDVKHQKKGPLIQESVEEEGLGEGRLRFSKMNTFGKYSSQQTDSNEGNGEKEGTTLKAFLDRKSHLESGHEKNITEPFQNRNEVNVRYDTNNGLYQKKEMLVEKGGTKDSYLSHLLNKVGKSPHAAPHFAAPQNKFKSEISSQRDKSRDGGTRLGYANPKLAARDSEGTLSTPRPFTRPKTPVRAEPGMLHASHTKHAGHHLTLTASSKSGHSSRKLQIDINRLIQRTAEDLNS